MTMRSKPKSDRENSLLAAIQRKSPAGPTAVPAVTTVPEPEAGPHPKAARHAGDAAAPKSRVGKPAQFWLHDEDRRLLRELAAWLAGQGLRPTDSMVVRAALRMAKTGGDLLEAYWQASQLDGRLKHSKSR